jgi:hypothetical protein
MRKDSLDNYVKTRYESLITTDKIRQLRLLEIIQYAFLYAIVTLLFSTAIEYMAPEPNEDEHMLILLLEIFIQCTIVAISVFYIRKIVKLVPFMYYQHKKYHPYLTSEYQGEIVISLVFLNTQTKLIEKIKILERKIRDNFYKLFMNTIKA